MRDSFLIYTDQLEPLEELSLEERGIIMTAIMAYTRGREVPEMSRPLKIAWSYIRSGLERDGAKYTEKLKARSEAGRKGAEKRWQNMAKMANDGKAILPDSKMANIAVPVPVPVPDPVPQPVPEPVPVPVAGTQAPTAAQVTEYAKSIGYELDGQTFVDKYDATGWTLGGSPIRDWKAMVRRWKAQDEKKAPEKNTKIHNFDERSDDLDAEVLAKYKQRFAGRV